MKKPAGPLPDQPFTAEAAPIALKAKAKKIPQWKTDAKGLIRPLQPSPVKSDEPDGDGHADPDGRGPPADHASSP